MRKTVLLAVILFLLMIPGVLANINVTYVTNTPGGVTTCSGLSGEDLKFCNRLQNDLGYTVRVVDDGYVKSNSQTDWVDIVQQSDLIFLGDVETTYVLTTGPDRDSFCTNINNQITSDRKVFMTFKNIYKDTSDNLLGCAFGSPINLGTDFSYENNSCTAYMGNSFWKILKSGKLNGGLNLSIDNPIYVANHQVRIHGSLGGAPGGCTPYPNNTCEGWLGVSCQDVQDAGIYSLFNTTSKGVFWGLINPSDFTAQTWNMFDMTIWDLLDMSTWDVEAHVIPSNVTSNASFLIYALVKERGNIIGQTSQISVKYSTIPTTSSGNLGYNSNPSDPSFHYWYLNDVKISGENHYTVNVTAYKNTVLMGETSGEIDIGNLSVIISSVDYQPGVSYLINASTYLLNNLTPSVMKYKIWNMTDFSIIMQGNVNAGCSHNNSICQQYIQPGNWGQVILEVTADNSTLPENGGAYKIIKPFALGFNLSTNKNDYKPDEYLLILVNTSGPVTQANCSLIDPNGLKVVDNVQMNKTDDTHWNKSIALGPNALNGNYTVVAKVLSGELVEKNKTVGVKAWDMFSTLDNSSYSLGSNVTINVTSQNAYAPLNFTIKINVTDPDDDVVSLADGRIQNNATYTAKYSLSANSTSGTYTVYVRVNDTYRQFNKTMTFIAGGTDLVVSPLEWNVVTQQAGIQTKNFSISNHGSNDMTNINITEGGELEPYVSLSRNNISSLDADESINFTAYLNTSFAGNHTGNITVKSALASAVIRLSLNYSANGTQQPESKLAISPTYLAEVTVPEKIIERNFTLQNKGNTTATGITVNITGTDILTVISKPDTILAGNSSILSVKIESTGKQVGSYSGVMNVSSSVGNAQATFSVEIIGDLSVEADTLLLDLQALDQNITDLESKKKDTAEIRILYSEIEDLIANAKASYASEDYTGAKQSYDSAVAKVEELKGKITGLATAQKPPSDYSGVVWIFAIIIVVAIVGITAYKYKDKIIEAINKTSKKQGKTQPQQGKKEDGEDYYYPSGGDEYRTDYY